MARIKLLFLAANTDPAARLQLDTELKQIRRFLDVTPEWDALEIVPEPEVEAIQLPQLLMREKPDIIHFAGHADKTGRLHLHGSAMAVGRVTPDALYQLLDATKAGVKLVIFNTCFSAPAATKVVEIVPFCIGTKASIDDAVAIQFSAFFYQSLGFGSTIGAAYKYAKAGVAVTLGSIPEDEHPQIEQQPDADPNKLRLRSPRAEELERSYSESIGQLTHSHAEAIKQLTYSHTEDTNQLKHVFWKWGRVAVLAAVLAGVIGAILLLPSFGWLNPSGAEQRVELIKDKDSALAALTTTTTFLRNEIQELGGDEKPPELYPPDVITLDKKTATEELKSLPRGIGEVDLRDREVKLMNEWRFDVLKFRRGDFEQLLVLRSRESFVPPYKSCRFHLVVTHDVQITRAAVFLVRNSGDESSYRPVYRQMALDFKPEQQHECTLYLDRPRRGESLFILLWVSSFNNPKKPEILRWKGSQFSIELKDRRVK